MVFANNVAYSLSGTAVRFSGGSTGVTFTGNVVRGPVSGVFSGYVEGAGLSDFEDVSWDATTRDIRPTALGAIIGTGDSAHATADDYYGDARTARQCDAIELQA